MRNKCNKIILISRFGISNTHIYELNKFNFFSYNTTTITTTSSNIHLLKKRIRNLNIFNYYII